MDSNTDLVLQKSARVQNWEDEEKAFYDLETLRREFQKRLYGQERPITAPNGENGAATNGRS